MPRRPKPLVIAGVALIAAGVFVPAPVWINGVCGVPTLPGAPGLPAGAVLFRAGLVAIGLYALLVAALRRYLAAGGATPPAGTARPGTAELTAIALLTAAALALRLYRLDAGLWYDEILTYVQYAPLPFREILCTYTSENQHFLFSLAAHASFGIFGESAWALRLPAAVFGTLTIVAVWLFGRQVASPRDGLLGAALLAFSYHHIWFSQNARGYSGLLFWTMLSSWLLVRALRENRPALWLAYGVSAALGVYTHTTMAFLIAGQLLVYAAAALRDARGLRAMLSGLVYGFIPGGLLTFQLHALTLPDIRATMARTHSVVDAWKKPLWTLLEIARGMEVNFAGLVAAAIAIAVFTLGCWSYLRTRLLVLGLLFLPPVLGASYVLSVGHHLWPRFFFFAFGFAALVVIRGILASTELAGRLLRMPVPRQRMLGTAAATLLVLLSAASTPRAFGPKQDYGQALAWAQAQRGPDEAVVAAGLASWAYRNFYKADIEYADNLPALEAVRSRHRRTYVLYTLEPVLEAMRPDIMQTLRRDFRVVKRFGGTLQDGALTVCVYERAPEKGI